MFGVSDGSRMNGDDDAVSLREFIGAVMHERDRAHVREHELVDRALRIEAQLREEAISRARQVVEARLEHLNELRSEVLQDRASYVTRDMFDLRLAPLEQFRARALGFRALVSLFSAVIGAVIAAVILR